MRAVFAAFAAHTRLLTRAAIVSTGAYVSASIPSAATDSGVRTADQERAAHLNEKWLREEMASGYVPPDASWPKGRPRRTEVPTLRRDFEGCGGISHRRCEAIGVELAFALLGRVLFGHSEQDEQEEADEAAAADEIEGVCLLRDLANAGSPVAACGYAMCLADGHGELNTDASSSSSSRAIDFYTFSAQAGYEHAQHALGCAYYLGEGTAVDERRAVEWFERAAAQGHPNAQFMLGECLLEGVGVEQADPAAAMQWFFRAGEQGHVGARARIRCTLLGMPFKRPLRNPERILPAGT